MSGSSSEARRAPTHLVRLHVALAAILAAVACSAPATERPRESPPAPAAAEPHAASTTPAAAEAPSDAVAITVYKSPSCGCCTKWVDHMREHGFDVTAHDVADVTPVKQEMGVPQQLGSCHTAVVGGYVVEGHVPADVVRQLLRERPEVLGIAVPGMPMGSPGMEGPYRDAYDVIAFGRDGTTRVYATR